MNQKTKLTYKLIPKEIQKIVGSMFCLVSYRN